LVYLSVEEYAKKTGMSVQAVYKKIRLNQLKTDEKMQSGRIKKFIKIEEVEDFIKPVEQDNSLQNSNNTISYIESMQRIHEDYRSLVQQNIELAQLAGQAKLLVDSEHRTKEEYFRTIQENKLLTEEKSELKAKLELLQEQNKKLEEKIERQDLFFWFKKL